MGGSWNNWFGVHQDSAEWPCVCSGGKQQALDRILTLVNSLQAAGAQNQQNALDNALDVHLWAGLCGVCPQRHTLLLFQPPVAVLALQTASGLRSSTSQSPHLALPLGGSIFRPFLLSREQKRKKADSRPLTARRGRSPSHLPEDTESCG